MCVIGDSERWGRGGRKRNSRCTRRTRTYNLKGGQEGAGGHSLLKYEEAKWAVKSERSDEPRRKEHCTTALLKAGTQLTQTEHLRSLTARFEVVVKEHPTVEVVASK